MVALGTRRPPHIREDEFDVPALTLDDFEFKDLKEYMPMISQDCALAWNRQENLAMVFIEKARLCVHIGSIVSNQPSTSLPLSNIESPRERKSMDIDLIFLQKSDQCDGALHSWLRDLPPVALYDQFTVADLLQDGKTFPVYLSYLHMLYHAAVIALHRSSTMQESRCKVREAAASITSILNNLRTLSLVHYIPITSFTFITPAYKLHLQEQGAQGAMGRQDAMKDFAKFMKELSRDYEPSKPSPPGLESTTHTVSSSECLHQKERVRALNPGPGMSFYSILDDITNLIPPSGEALKPQPVQTRSLTHPLPPQEPEVTVSASQTMLDDGMPMKVSFDIPFSPNYEDFLMDGMLVDDPLISV